MKVDALQHKTRCFQHNFLLSYFEWKIPMRSASVADLIRRYGDSIRLVCQTNMYFSLDIKNNRFYRFRFTETTLGIDLDARDRENLKFHNCIRE